MGLDIYLYKCPDRPRARAAEQTLSEYEESLWKQASKPYGQYTEPEKDAIRTQKWAKAIELRCVDDRHESVAEITINSRLYPEHMFKIGYFRSSYNAGGIERILKNLHIEGLREIFDYFGQYEFTPDWTRAAKVVADSIEKYSARLAADGGLIKVRPVAMNYLPAPSKFPQSEEDAMRVLKEEMERYQAAGNKHEYDNYDNLHGWFMPQGWEIIAAIPGMTNILASRPCVYIAWRDKQEAGCKDWYLQALEIVQETIAYVLDDPHPEHFYLHWSS